MCFKILSLHCFEILTADMTNILFQGYQKVLAFWYPISIFLIGLLIKNFFISHF